MSEYSKKLQTATDTMLARNSLILFNLDDKPVKFSYQRHICSKLIDIPGNNREERIINSIIMAISLWFSWEIHAKNTNYPYKWYGCVQVENQWLLHGQGTPPYVIFNSESPRKIEEFKQFKTVEIGEFPLNINSLAILRSRDYFVRKAYFEEDNSITWRLCQKESLGNQGSNLHS